MRTARTLTNGGVSDPGGVTWGVSDPGGVWPGGCLTWGVWPGGVFDLGEGVCVWPGGVCDPGGVPCDLSHHAFDVITCMLPPHQLRPTNSAAAYIVLDLQGMLGYTPPLLTEWQTPVKT